MFYLIAKYQQDSHKITIQNVHRYMQMALFKIVLAHTKLHCEQHAIAKGYVRS